MTDPWWRGIPPAQAVLDCADQSHRLRWHAGAVTALDHADADRERSLTAVSGPRSRCLSVVEGWARHSDDLRVLVLASRGPADPLSGPIERPGPAGRWFAYSPLGGAPRPWTGRADYRPGAGYGPGVPDRADPDDELIELLTLGGVLPDRLAATVAASWARRLRTASPSIEAARPALRAALYGRALAALRGWLARPELAVHLDLVEENAEPTLRRTDGGVHLGVPFGWLVTVWATGLCTVWGRFCLSAQPIGDRVALTTVGPDLGSIRRIVVDRPEPD